MTFKNIFLFPLWITAGLVGIYQLPLIQNNFSSHGVENDINDYFPYSQSIQQNIEDYKISFSASLDSFDSYLSVNKHEDDKKIKLVVNNVAKNPIIKEEVMPPPTQAINVSLNTSLKKEDVKEQSVSTSNSNINNIEKNSDVKLISQNQTLNPETNVSHNTLESSQQVTTNNTISDVRNNCEHNCKVLMIGDSVMGDVDFSLARLLKKEKPDWKVIDAHKVSSGLVNKTYYDWPKTSSNLIAQHKPDYVFVLIGTNDAQGMMINGKGTALGKPNWINEYKSRISQINDDFSKNNALWYWIQLPVVKDNGFNERLQYVRQTQAEALGNKLIETETIFGKVDHSQEIDMKLRANDGTHLNSLGANLVAKHIYEYLQKNHLNSHKEDESAQ